MPGSSRSSCTFVRNDSVGRDSGRKSMHLIPDVFLSSEASAGWIYLLGRFMVYLPLLAPTPRQACVAQKKKKCSTQYRKHSCLGISAGLRYPKGSQNSTPCLEPRQTDLPLSMSLPKWVGLFWVCSKTGRNQRDLCLTASFCSQDLLANPSNPAQPGSV